MGREHAAIYQRQDYIRSPGGYLRNLVDRADDHGLGPGQVGRGKATG